MFANHSSTLVESGTDGVVVVVVVVVAAGLLLSVEEIELVSVKKRSLHANYDTHSTLSNNIN